MRVRSYLLLGLILASPAASAICIDVPLEQQITKASTVFVATITGASLRPALPNLHDQQAYTVHYTFAVAKIVNMAEGACHVASYALQFGLT
jgi:hypothetical protein